MSIPTWSVWRPLAGWQPNPLTLAETLDGGQSFRWFREDKPSALRSLGEVGPVTRQSGVWTGQWANCLAQLRLQDGRLEWRAPADRVRSVADALPLYLGLKLDWPGMIDALPWRSDPHLAQCLHAFPELRILRQPFGETLLGFLCSATKQIVQIKQMVALLAERHGSEIGRARTSAVAKAMADGPLRTAAAAKGLAALPAHQLPTWEQLALIPEKNLRACLLGFRAKYIHASAQYIAQRPGWLEETEHLPYPAAKARLLELPGVGEKVADCVLLFGAGKFEAFPVDTWILKSLERRYQLTGWKPAQVAHFGRTHFGPLAGLAQQYLFAWERKFGR